MALCPFRSIPFGPMATVFGSRVQFLRSLMWFFHFSAEVKEGFVSFFLSALARTTLENLNRHFVRRNEKKKRKKLKKKKADRLAIVPQSKPNWTWVAGCGCGLKKQVCICRIHSKIGFQRLARRRAQRAIIPVRMC